MMILDLSGGTDPCRQLDNESLEKELSCVDFQKYAGLNLSNNRFTSSGAQYLAEKIENSKVKHFRVILDGTPVGADGIEALLPLCNRISLIVEARDVEVKPLEMDLLKKEVVSEFSMITTSPRSS